MQDVKKDLIELFDEFLNSSLSKRISLLPEIHILLISKEMKKAMKKLLRSKDLDSHDILFLEYIIRAANLIYTETTFETGLTDSEYDALNSLYVYITKRDLPFTELVTNEGDLIKPKYSLGGTLSKIYKISEDDVLKNASQKSIEDWVKSTLKILKVIKNDDSLSEDYLWNQEIEVFMKFDGLSVMIEYDENQNILRALTRGDVSNDEALNITNVIKLAKIEKPFKNISDKTPFGEFCVKYEAMMCDEYLSLYNEEFKREYKNTRSAVSSIINSKELDKERVKYLTFVPHRYTYFEKGKETIPLVSPGAYDFPSLRCKLSDLEKISQFSKDNKNVHKLGEMDYHFRCDGAVIRLKDIELCKLLGSQGHKPRYEVAYKFTEEYGYSDITGASFQVGIFGRVTPVINFSPIKLKGNIISNAAVSYPRFKELRLKNGDICKISYDIIPYLDFDKEDIYCLRNKVGKEITFPDNCPVCGEPLIESVNGGFIECTNKNCDCRKKGKILNFLDKIGVEGISISTIDTLFENKILTSIKDVFNLNKKKKEILELEGFGKKKFNAFINSIEEHKTITPSRLLASVGIPDVGIKKFSQILSIIDYTTLLEIAENDRLEELLSIPGIKEVTANKIINGIKENIDLLDYLEDVMQITKEKSKDNILFKCVFTKIRDKDVESWIESVGGYVADTVGKDTTFVIVPDKNVSSSKVDKAIKYNIPIIEIDEIKSFVESHFEEWAKNMEEKQ